MIGIHDDGDIGSNGTINKFENNDCEKRFRIGWIYTTRRSAPIRSRSDLEYQVKEGYTKKLAHLWHGPFRVVEKVGEHAVKLEIAGSGYHVFPVLHLTKLKLVKEYPDRPLWEAKIVSILTKILLRGDSWIQNRDPDEYEVEKITDMRSGTRYGRIYREFLVHWRGYEDPTWVDEADLNCSALLHEFLRDHMNHNRIGVMQSHEETPTSHQEVQPTQIEQLSSHQERKIQPNRRVHKITDHRRTPFVSRCPGIGGKSDLATSQISLIPLHHNRHMDMASVGSPDRHPSSHEYDPDDPDLDPPRRAAVA
ncbi:LOW QUALITY PROTEIN: Hypothetical protein PHPALM_20075 [Phytophthora palmivora]|uniref:Chromo domain-containing protein n=1 Tax=Phytophthora palmivora TaxID=4796 RepID=A0A2P4XFS6_9STRA|nr:LOW QUALITY PROTEIN: Hypothetical protein PHPALM_20075 [Phytophthora palmivora]